MNMTKNSAGGNAYAMSSEHALAQLVSTGFIGRVYDASQKDDYSQLLELCKKCSPEFVAKTAIYSRQVAFLKDAPAYLCAYLAGIGRNDLLTKVWPQVMDNPKMVRNFVQIIRKGLVGRKSLGSAPKRLVQNWLKSKTPSELFRNSIGGDPSLKDVISMVHPKPESPEQEQMFRYLLGKDADLLKLPPEISAFEKAKRSKEPLDSVPNVPWEMATSLPLSKKGWLEVASRSTWMQTLKNLASFQRHGVFEDNTTLNKVGDKLSNKEMIQKGKVFPYQVYNAYLNTTDLPQSISDGLRHAVMHSLQNVPSLEDKSIKVLVDVSGSMGWNMNRGTQSKSKIRFIDIAALFASALAVKNSDVEIIPFDTEAQDCFRAENMDVFQLADKLTSYLGGGTDCSSAVRYLNQNKKDGQLVVIISDNESWAGRTYGKSTSATVEWDKFKQRNPHAKLVNLDIAPNASTQVVDREDILNLGGFSDQIFNVISSFLQSRGESHWVGMINSISLENQ